MNAIDFLVHCSSVRASVGSSDRQLNNFIDHIQEFEDSLRGKAPDVSRAKAFIYMLLLQVCIFASNDWDNFNIYHPMLKQLVEIIQRGSDKFSYQMIQDLTSETFRLCIISKITVYYRCTHRKYKKSDSFKEVSRDVKHRMDALEFEAFSSQLDKELDQHRCHFPELESAGQLIQTIRAFQPHIMNGYWDTCSRGHYFCVPVCEVGVIEMKCPECHGGEVVNPPPPTHTCSHAQRMPNFLCCNTIFFRVRARAM